MNAIRLAGHPDIQIVLKPNPRSRRITLRHDPRGGFQVSYPPRLSQRKVEAFVESQTHWLLDHNRPMKRVEIGGSIPVFGREFAICLGEKRGLVATDDQLYVKSVHPARAVQAWLRSQAELYAPSRIDYYANRIGKEVAGLRWRDAKTRWGSCSVDRVLMLNWRLVMAPRSVFDYVIAHEVAHLQHMDHSRDFWALVQDIDPDFQSSRRWLKQYGHQIQAYDFRAE